MEPCGLAVEIGCGAGYVASRRAEKCGEVVGIDIELEALRQARLRIGKSNIHLVCGRSLTCIRSDARLGLIVSNPPYLPDDEVRDPTIHGGPTGIETTLEILSQAEQYLERGCVALIIMSSLSNTRAVEEWARQNDIAIEKIAQKHLFFEKITAAKLFKQRLARANR